MARSLSMLFFLHRHKEENNGEGCDADQNKIRENIEEL
jgi:hypothetical protein